jgi:hypothetical protein
MRRALMVLLSAAAATSCYQAWPLVGPYHCNVDSCPSGLVCDDGLCCKPFGVPACPTLVLDGGSCAAGGAPKTYYEDLDGDGYGNLNAPRLLCSQPVVEPFVDNSLDCDDSSAEANPKGAEKCDGLDNNCDGTIDEGLMPVKTYFRDQDGDGYGDPAVTLIACAAPKGWVESNSDCEPTLFTIHPGAQELCNNLDDNCNKVKDEGAIDVGGDCADAGKGECNAGIINCVAGAKVCQSKNAPKAELCDTVDNNCNGAVDEQPDCGGPVSLRIGPGSAGGAKDMKRSIPFAELSASCHKDEPGSAGESWSVPTWTGSGGSDHLLYFEAPGASTWDLSRAGLKLRLALSWSMGSPQVPPWQAASQPVVFICAENGSFSRYVHAGPDGGVSPAGYLITTASGTLDEVIPLAAGNQWVQGNGSGADLKKVKRIEVMVRPSGVANQSTPTFSFTVGTPSGFVP